MNSSFSDHSKIAHCANKPQVCGPDVHADLQTVLAQGRTEELEHWTSECIQIPSLNPPGNEAPVTEFLERLCLLEGLEAHRIATKTAGRESLVVRLQGCSRQALAFTGHQDVVPVSEAEQERWQRDPFSGTIEGEWIHGRGSSDMKGGLMAALYALVCVKRSGHIPPQDLLLLITCDEENRMLGSHAIAKTPWGEAFSELVVCEPTKLQLCRVGKGRTWAQLLVRGQTAHGSQQGVGQNAIDLATDLMFAIRNLNWKHHSNDQGESFIRTLAIQAGVEPQVVPDTCTLLVDARLTTHHDPATVWEEIRALWTPIEVRNPGSALEIDIQDLREPWITQKSSPIVQRFHQACRSLNQPIHESVFAGTTDGTVLRRKGAETIIVGPGDLSCVHRENERLSRQELTQAWKLYTAMMLQPNCFT